MAEKKENVSKFEMLKLLEKCRKERDDAVHRESIMREKLRQYESRMRSTEVLKQKLKTVTLENKELRKHVKTLRQDIGLEASPKFNGKTTKDIISDMHEKERQYRSLVEKTGRLSLTIDDLTSELANAVTSKTLLEYQLQSLQQNLKDMTNNQRRLLKLWDDKRSQREHLTLPAIGLPQRPGEKPVSHKGVQTEMSINSAQKLPPNAFETKPPSPRSRYHKRRSSIDKQGGLTTLGNGNQLGNGDHQLGNGNHHTLGNGNQLGNGDHQLGNGNHHTLGNGNQLGNGDHQLGNGNHHTLRNGHQLGNGDHQLGNGNHHTLGNGNHQREKEDLFHYETN
uniref:Zgc:113691 n=1 Tax=Hucho hucho TaxID=62062 RepID=A0A4W5KFG9_9TELE